MHVKPNNVIKSTIKYCLLLVWTVLTTGCIKEDMSDCFSSIRLRFSYTLHDEPTQGNLFGRDVRHIRAYVFDADGVLNTVASERGSLLSNDYVMNLDLDPGTYTIVAWGSGGEDFFRSYRQSQGSATVTDPVPGQTTLDQLRIALACEQTPDADGNLHPAQAQFDDLFYGAAGTRSTDGKSLYTIIPVELSPGRSEERTVELIRNTNIIRLTVEGVWNFDPATGIDAWITGTDTRYTSKNTIESTSPRVRFLPRRGLADATTIHTDISIQRLEWNRTASEPLSLYVKDLVNDKVLAKLDLVGLLQKAQDGSGNPLYRNQEDFDREYIYPVTLSFAEDLSLRIYVKDWLIQDIKPEL